MIFYRIIIALISSEINNYIKKDNLIMIQNEKLDLEKEIQLEPKNFFLSYKTSGISFDEF